MEVSDELASLGEMASRDGGAEGPDLFEWFDLLLAAFVAAHAGLTQRGGDWYRRMGLTVGGSEASKLLRMSPYGSFYDVVGEKVAIQRGEPTWNGGGAACWWGTLCEPLIEDVVSADLGAPIRGSDICIQAAPGYRNSPDGYIVVRCERPEGEPMRLWTTDRPLPDGAVPLIAMLEFKCPYSRLPTGRVPSQYKPQVWSGLAVSPPAHLGLFVDSVFRKCSLEALGPGPEFDSAYHRGASGSWEAPVAWGLIAVYAPLLRAPRHVRLGWAGPEWAAGDPSPEAPDADAALAAWEIHSGCLGATSRAQDGRLDAVDFGDCPTRLFDRALGLVDRRRFRVVASRACFADGRGPRLDGPDDVGDWIAERLAGAPDGHWLLGVLPWKLFSVDYVPVTRHHGFLEELLPLIDAVHAMAAEALASPDPTEFLRVARATRPAPGRPARSRADPEASRDSAHADPSVIQDLFDALALE